MKDGFLMTAFGAAASCIFVHVGFGVLGLEPTLLAIGEGLRDELGLA